MVDQSTRLQALPRAADQNGKPDLSEVTDKRQAMITSSFRWSGSHELGRAAETRKHDAAKTVRLFSCRVLNEAEQARRRKIGRVIKRQQGR